MSSSWYKSDGEERKVFGAGYNRSKQMPGSYHSPISGYPHLPIDEIADETSYCTSTTFKRLDDGYEETPAHMTSKLSQQVDPSHQRVAKLSKHTSTQTLRAESENVDQINDDADLDWDNDSQTGVSTTVAPLPTLISNTWSASSKLTKEIANALRSSDEAGPSSPNNLSCSLPTPTHMPSNVVNESWDDDFLFHDHGEEESGSYEPSGPSTNKQVESQKSNSRQDWDEEDDEEWGASSSVGNHTSIPTSASSSTLTASKHDRLPIHLKHLDRSGSGHRGRSTTARSSSSSSHLQSFISERRVARQSDSSIRADAGTLFRDKIASRSDNSIVFSELNGSTMKGGKQAKTGTLTPSRKQTVEAKKLSINSRRATSDSKVEEAPSGSNGDISEKLHEKSIMDSSAKIQPRQAEGHWSHFLSSRLNQAKSPERSSKLKPINTFGHDKVLSRTQSPPVSPSAIRSRELSASKDKVFDGEVPSQIKATTHRRGATSLSMSFNLMAPWGWAHRSSQKSNEVLGSLACASTSSVSLASITADTGRLAGDTVKPDAFSTTTCDRPNQGHKRKLDGWVESEDRDGQDTNRPTLESKESRSQIMAHSPSSFRAPLMINSSRSYSGSASIATTAMSSSDCTTSTGSITEESTLYGSIDDASKLLTRNESLSFQGLSRSPSVSRDTIFDFTSLPNAEKVTTPSARRIRVSTTRPAAGIESVLSPPKTMQSATDIQIRLPSDPTFSTIASRNRNSTKQHGRSSNSIDSVVRRSSLSDLRIPSRITKAQEGIRINMNRVKDFAYGIEELRMLREQYQDRINEYSTSDAKRLEVEEEYSSWWECAEVLIGLGQGKGGVDDETNVDTLEHIQPLSASPSLSSNTKQVESFIRRPSTVFFSPDQAFVTRSAIGTRPASSRGSSSRSIDPQREIDILSAMLAGTPMEDISPIRPELSLRERSMSANEGLTTTRNNKSGSSIMRQREAQGQLPFAGNSATSLSFADVNPSPHRSRLHRTSASLSSSAYFQQRRDAALLASSSVYPNEISTLFSGAISTESVDTQGATRRMRLKSTGKVGLQGLKDLIRMFKINSTAQVYQGEAHQSRTSLPRTSFSEARISFEDAVTKADTSDEIQAKPLSRTRSLFGKTMSRSESHSPTLQRRTNPIIVDDSHLSSRSSSMASSNDPSASVKFIFNRTSSGAESSAKDTSMDSDWTQGDFDQMGIEDVVSDSRPEITFEEPDTLSAKSNAGKRRFFLFSKGFPPSAARRHSRDVLNWASSSKESLDLSPIRHSLQLKVKESPPHSSLGGMPRVTSNAKHPLLTSRANAIRRSRSSSSTSASLPNSNLGLIDLKTTTRPSKGSTTTTVSTIESNSSSGTQIVTPTTEAFQADEVNTKVDNPINHPQSSQEAIDINRKLAFNPEAIPSLLVYLETTKARCQESLSRLN